MIETERLLLRKFQHEDFDAMFIILSDPEIMQHYGCKSVYETGKQEKWTYRCFIQIWRNYSTAKSIFINLHLGKSKCWVNCKGGL